MKALELPQMTLWYTCNTEHVQFKSLEFVFLSFIN